MLNRLSRRLRACALLTLGLSWSGAVVAAGTSDLVSKFDRAMAGFNPVGEYVRKPIERTFPDLSIRGFYRNWSDVLIDGEGQAGNRAKDFRYLQLQNLFELQANYHLGTGLDIRGVAHAMYDAVYDVQDARGLFANRLDSEAEYYNTSERILRELYVSWRRPGFDLLVGKQQVAWGKMDGQFIDIVNSMDRREAVQLETEDFTWRRLPTWMANATFHFGKTSLQLLYLFDFEHDRQALPGSPWASPLLPAVTNDIVLPVERPAAGNFDDHQYGLRVDRSAGALTYGFVYMYAWDKNPVDHVLGTAVNGGQTVLRIAPRHERLHHAGVTADYALTLQDIPVLGSLPTVLRFEALYSNGVRVADFRKRADALAGRNTDGTTKRDTLRAAIAIEFALPGRSTLIFQPSWYQTIGHREELGYGFGGGIGDEWSFFPVLFFSRPFGFSRDRLSMEFTAFPLISGPDAGWGGLKTKLRLVYKFSQFVRGQLVYNGYDTGSATDYYGQYRQWDNFGWELSYEF